MIVRALPLLLLTAVMLVMPPASADETRLSPELLWKLGRLGDAALSADGSRVAYTVRRYELAENSGSSELSLIDADAGPGDQRVLLEGWDQIANLQFASHPRGERLWFVGRKDSEGDAQVWTLHPDGGSPRQVTRYEDGLANLRVAPDGSRIAFTRRVKMEPETVDIYPDLPQADAKIIDRLMFRHWNRWDDGHHSHLHVAELDRSGRAGDPIDLMRGIRADCPLPPFGGSEQFAWSPDSQQLALTAKVVNNPAESTDSNIYLVPADGSAAPELITAGMPGYDTDPVFSPDGKTLALHSMRRASFESDRNRLMLYDLGSGQLRELTEGLDQMAHHGLWLPDSSGMLFDSEYRGTNQIFGVQVGQRGARQRSDGQFNWQSLAVFPDGKRMLVSRMSMLRPAELAVLSLEDGSAKTLTGINDPLYRDLELPRIEQRWVRSSDGAQVHCWVIYPPDFDPQQTYPLLTYCQGGPQGQIGQWFSYRWNFHLMAAQGYVVVAPNRRGLPGFGRQWNDQISGDWGGQAMQDILAATDAMRTEPYVDIRRTAAIGASFGGYTTYWLMGNHEDRFACMISHCGVFNLESMYGSTEELFFVNWDMGGPYWKNRMVQRRYDDFSPHRYVQNWRTPLLVIHGEKDFRVPVTQGIEAFTAAQVQGVRSRFLYFPNEGHWVLGPQNGVLWHRVFFEWLDEHLGAEEADQ